jgi:peptide/nickel transport system permease protein
MSRAAVRILVRYLLLAGGVVLLNFLIPRLLPGDPLSVGAAEGLDQGPPLSAAARADLRSYYHLDDPLAGQLVAYLGDLARGDLGWSIARAEPVGALLRARLPWTLGLVGTALLLSAVGGTALGALAGWVPGSRRDRLLVALTAGLSALPEFLIAIGLLLLFAITLRWFPLVGGQTPFAQYGADALGSWRRALDVGWHLVLPAATLTLAGIAGFALIARDVTVGIRAAPWLTVARAKGLSERQVALRHALPNLAGPLVTYFGLRLGAIFGGALVVERVFNVPGLGLLAYESIRGRDYPVLQALFLLAGLGVLGANCAVEFLYVRMARRQPARYE